MSASLKRMLLAAVCSASFASFAVGPAVTEADTPQPVIWCAANLGSDTESTSDSVVLAYQAARSALCQGDAPAAVRALQAILPDMRTRYKADGTHWIDYGRTYFYALLATHDDAGARRLLDELENGWKPSPEDRAAWNGEFVRSFSGYVADSGAAPDPHLSYAVADLAAKDLPSASGEVQAFANPVSLSALMLGNLYADQRDWPHAFAAWIAAAVATPSPPTSSLDRWNVSALELIYNYRAHAPAQAPVQTVFCGSPHDLATVEALALALPQSAGLDATHIVDASIAGGAHARVDVESKGEFAAYFDLVNGQWQPIPRAQKSVTFPAGCPNPRFVNHPSG